MQIEVDGLDHIYVTVSDIARSERFYDPVMQMLGFRKKARPIDDTPHVHYFNRVTQYSLRPARSAAPMSADPYAVGALHHLCMRVADRGAVQEAHRLLRELGIAASEPRLYPQYRHDYYAIFFEDPDGVRLEIVCDTQLRRTVRERWDELSDFVDPVSRLQPHGQAGVRQQAHERAARGAPNFWHGDSPPERGESFQELARLDNVTVERIISSQHPDSGLYDQLQGEWVLLLRGEASVEVGGELRELCAGDHLLLPPRTPHRVLRTSRGATWLAVHVHPSEQRA
jgi:glyoxylase I family protein